MSKKALCIGCNYSGRMKLNGCVNDCFENVQLASKLGVPSKNLIVLADSAMPGGISAAEPTKQNILNGIKGLVQGAQSGDMLYLSFSGHGTQVPDRSGEEADGMDEALVPGDYEKTGRVITDDELAAYLVKPLPEGVLLTCIFDCCHSGTILDLDACIDSTSSHVRKAGKQKYKRASRDLDLSEYGGDVLCRAIPPIMDYVPDEIPEPEFAERSLGGPAVFCFSGCRDDQTSLDVTIGGKKCGALTNCWVQSLNSGGTTSDYKALFSSVLANMDDLRKHIPRLAQCPQLSYEECAAPDGVKFCCPARGGAGFPPAAPAAAPFYTGQLGKTKKDKKEKKEKKDKHGKTDKKEKKDKKGKSGGKDKKEKKGKKDKRRSVVDDSDDSSSSSDSEDENNRKKADAGKAILGAMFSAFN